MFTTKCASCNDAVGHGPDCSMCKGKYHFKCGDITERGFSRLGTARSSWTCPSCRDGSASQSKLDISKRFNPEFVSPTTIAPGTPKNSSGLAILQCPSTSSTPKVTTIDDKPFLALLNDISSKISDMQMQLETIHSIQNDIQLMKNDIADIKTTVNSGFDQLTSRISDVESRVSALEDVKSEIVELKAQLKGMKEDSYKNDQWVRRSNIQINGVPQKAGENLFKIVESIAVRSGYTLNPNTDIDFVTRVAVKNDTDNKKSKPIIVKLQSRYKKDDLLALVRKLKDLKASDIGFHGMTGRIYCNDHLSAYNKYLLQQAKLKVKEKNYAYCWVRNCTIMVRQSEKSPVLHITSEESLKKIV